MRSGAVPAGLAPLSGISPGTSVPGFHMPPLRGWSFGDSRATALPEMLFLADTDNLRQMSSMRGRYGIFHYYAAFHYPLDVLELGDVSDGVGFYGDHVCVVARFQGTYFIFPSH